ncbi:MAG: hypothetical protein Q8K89_11795 [Actinomycetota bacterium]|nr:hypothetical protein [Actinomycetota bacterium]
MGRWREPTPRTELDVIDWSGLGRYLVDAESVQHISVTGSAWETASRDLRSDAVEMPRPQLFGFLPGPQNHDLFRKTAAVVDALVPLLDAGSGIEHFRFYDQDRRMVVDAYDWDVRGGPVTLYGGMRDSSQQIVDLGLAAVHQVGD